MRSCGALQLGRVCGCMAVQVYPGRTALVVSLNNLTENVYLGNKRSMTIPIKQRSLTIPLIEEGCP